MSLDGLVNFFFGCVRRHDKSLLSREKNMRIIGEAFFTMINPAHFFYQLNAIV